MTPKSATTPRTDGIDDYSAKFVRETGSANAYDAYSHMRGLARTLETELAASQLQEITTVGQLQTALEEKDALQARVAELERDAGRWKFCEVHGFPRYMPPHSARHSFRDPSKTATEATPGYWIAARNDGSESARGDTPGAAIDKAQEPKATEQEQAK